MISSEIIEDKKIKIPSCANRKEDSYSGRLMQPPLAKVLYHKTALFAIHFYKQKEVFFL